MLLQVVPFLLMQVLGCVWFLNSNILEMWPRTFLWTAGLLFAKMAMHLMLAHLCHQRFNPMRRTFLAVLGVAAAAGYVHLKNKFDAYSYLELNLGYVLV